MDLLKISEATPKELFEYMTDKYGFEWTKWEPETIWQTTGAEDSYVKNKLQAIQVIVNNQMFWTEWEVFEKVTLAFNNIPPNFQVIEEVSPAQMAFAIRSAYKIRRDARCKVSGKEPVFNQEVKIYIATRAYLDGTVYLPGPLDIAQSELDRLTGQQKLAKEIEDAHRNPSLEVKEDAVSIGAIKALIVKTYAFSDERKSIV